MKENMTIRPVLRYWVPKIFEKLPTAGLPRMIQPEGQLENEIGFIEGGRISSASGTSSVIRRAYNPKRAYDQIIDFNQPVDSTPKCEVVLHESYCRFLWLFSALTQTKVEYFILSKVAQDEGYSSVDELISALVKENSPQDQEMKIIQDIRKFYEERLQYEQMLFTLASLAPDETLELDNFSFIDFTRPYAEKINSVMCYGVVFILSHEVAHVALGHMEKR